MTGNEIATPAFSRLAMTGNDAEASLCIPKR